MRTLKLTFNLLSGETAEPEAIGAEGLMEEALRAGFRWIHLDWNGVTQVDLPVEDDVMFLVMSYAEVDEFCKTGHAHDVFLGDGLLIVCAERKDEMATMDVRHTPHLDRRFTTSQTVATSLPEYRRAWSALIYELVCQVRMAPESASR